MKISELDYVEQDHAFNFLKKVAELVNGDVRKKVQFEKVWTEIGWDDDTNFPMTKIAFRNRILPILVQDKLLGCDKKDEVNILYEGIYRVSEHYQVSSETFGILSRNDLEKYSQSFQRLLIELTLKTDFVTIKRLKKRYYKISNYLITLLYYQNFSVRKKISVIDINIDLSNIDIVDL